MNAKRLGYLKATVGAIVLVVLVLQVRGWWGEYRDASERLRAAESTSTASAQETSSPDAGEGEGATGDGKASESPKPVKAAGTVVVLIDGLNFRTKPEADAKPIRGLRKGEKLTVLSERSGWYEVRSADGTKGWVSSNPNYVEREK